MRNSWMRKQYVTLAGTCACFRTSYSHRLCFGCPNLMTVARIPTLNDGFFSKKRDLLVMTSKTQDMECLVKPFARNARAIGMQRL